MLTVRETDFNDLDVAQWNNLLVESEICDAFQTYEWATVLRNSMKVRPRFLLLERGSQIKGGVMFFRKRTLGLIDSYEVRGGPLYVKGHKEEVMEGVFKTLRSKRKNALNLLFVPFPGINNSLEHMFRNEGYFSYPFRTIIIDLERPLESVWKALNKKARWSVRKAERLGLELRTATTWKEWQQYQSLHVVHGREKQYPTDPPEFFHEVFKLQGKNLARLFLAEYEKQVVAGSLFLVFGRNMVFLQNASKAEFLSRNPNSFLQWKSIEWAKENGVVTYDMNGLPPQQVPYLRGVYKYKKQWDGYIQWYYYYLSRRLPYYGIHLIRTSNYAWKLFLQARNLKAV
ncbi:MAG: GNAT family N-acetyltransferase [Candidatus Bathyarchaeota archaeon]|nr:MAG: GNAT family N-acetyltransferase [Candidatus Bathyarchaeota archaeon]